MSLPDKIKSASYKFAKSMPKIPHSYSLRENWDDPKEFEEAVQYIRDHGVVERFYSKQYTYLYLDGYKYWTMGSPLEKTKLINRAKVDD